MANASDLAAHLIERFGPMTPKKLQKLCYYTQSWSLAWGRGTVFGETIEAWKQGPVVEALWQQNAGAGSVLLTRQEVTGDPSAVASWGETIDVVYGFYGSRSADWLSQLTHREAPWMDARRGVDPDQRSKNPITTEALREFYTPLAEKMGDHVLSDAYSRGCELLLSLTPDEVAGLTETVDATPEEVEEWLQHGSRGSPLPGTRGRT